MTHLAGCLDGTVDILGLRLGHGHKRLARARIVCLKGLAARSVLKFAIDQQLETPNEICRL